MDSKQIYSFSLPPLASIPPPPFISSEKDSKYFVMRVKIENESPVGRSWWERGEMMKLGCEEGWDKGLSVGMWAGLRDWGKI